MNRTMMISASLLTMLVLGCGGDGGNGGEDRSGGTDGGTGALATGEGPCDVAGDCQGGVCVELIDGNHPPNYCTQECGTCPSGFYCDEQTFALAGLSFCRYGDTPQTDPPAEPPRLPCAVDADCSSSTVCATYQGERECVVPCDVESDCTPPVFGGVTFDLATCGLDEAQSRRVCLPDPACYPNPGVCVSF